MPTKQAVKRSVQTEDVQAYATEQGLLFNEISAKQDIGVRSSALLSPPDAQDYGFQLVARQLCLNL